MILIADSGSTKTSWILTDGNKVVQNIVTSGYNPYYYKDEGLLNTIRKELSPQITTSKIRNIFFYGSGCSSEINCNSVKYALSQLFPNSDIEVNHDLYGAAIALLHNNKGIACILGTGSNSCYWDGYNIIHNVPSVGYLLGDEGSGTYIGMLILKGILEEKAPAEIIKSFYNKYNTTFEDVLVNIYNEPNPNRFISKVSLFAEKNIDNEWIRNTIKKSFIDFIENQLVQYENYQNLKVSFTGSVAYYYKKILMEACHEYDISPGIILKDPIEGLFNFHTKNKSKA
jgi:N-acetylglucosamine kinase-like BadF-type ATPase